MCHFNQRQKKYGSKDQYLSEVGDDLRFSPSFSFSVSARPSRHQSLQKKKIRHKEESEMVARKFLVRHDDSTFDIDYDTDDGFEVSSFLPLSHCH